MTLAELIALVEEMKTVANKFDANYPDVDVRIFGEHGCPRKAEMKVHSLTVRMDIAE